MAIDDSARIASARRRAEALRPSFRGGGRYVRVPSYDRRSSSGDHSGHFGLG